MSRWKPDLGSFDFRYLDRHRTAAVRQRRRQHSAAAAAEAAGCGASHAMPCHVMPPSRCIRTKSIHDSYAVTIQVRTESLSPFSSGYAQARGRNLVRTRATKKNKPLCRRGPSPATPAFDGMPVRACIASSPWSRWGRRRRQFFNGVQAGLRPDAARAGGGKS